MATRNNIKNALEILLGGGEPLTDLLAAVLDHCRLQASIDYQEVAAIAGDNTAELLLLAWDWKLLIPRSSFQCAEWDDRVLRLLPGERYEMVNVVQWLCASAAKTGAWHADAAIRDLYAAMGGPAFEKIPVLIRQLVRQAKHQRISGSGIHAACVHTGFQDRTGTMIAILKGGGIISPSLISSSPMEKRSSPPYDLHPVLLKLYGADEHGP